MSSNRTFHWIPDGAALVGNRQARTDRHLGDLGLTNRTCFVFVFVLMFAAVVVLSSELNERTSRNQVWVGLSGVTTTYSWVFYYRAIKLGQVSTVALIDKGSVVVALVLARRGKQRFYAAIRKAGRGKV